MCCCLIAILDTYHQVDTHTCLPPATVTVYGCWLYAVLPYCDLHVPPHRSFTVRGLPSSTRTAAVEARILPHILTATNRTCSRHSLASQLITPRQQRLQVHSSRRSDRSDCRVSAAGSECADCVDTGQGSGRTGASTGSQPRLHRFHRRLQYACGQQQQRQRRWYQQQRSTIAYHQRHTAASAVSSSRHHPAVHQHQHHLCHPAGSRHHRHTAPVSVRTQLSTPHTARPCHASHHIHTAQPPVRGAGVRCAPYTSRRPCLSQLSPSLLPSSHPTSHRASPSAASLAAPRGVLGRPAAHPYPLSSPRRRPPPPPRPHPPPPPLAPSFAPPLASLSRHRPHSPSLLSTRCRCCWP